METPRFKQLLLFECRTSILWFHLLTSYFLIFPLFSSRFSLSEFAAHEMSNV
jgi:hypothetical protein